jgi:universal stress protein A
MKRAISRILVPTDFSPASDAALEYAMTIAQRFGASAHVLHVVDDPFAGAATWGSEVYIASVPTIRETLIKQAAAKLSVLRTRAGTRGIAARTEVRFGRPAEVIREVAEHEASDLIVMGTRGRTGMAHLLLGSVAETMVREARCPVLTVRGDVDPLAAERELFKQELVPAE